MMPDFGLTMNNPIIIGTLVGVVSGAIIAIITRWRFGQWRSGTAIVVALIVGIITGVPAIWHGWIACTYGVVAGYMLGLVTIREAIHDKRSKRDEPPLDQTCEHSSSL